MDRIFIYNNTIHINKVGLEDLMTFQDVEFEVIDGYYFNQGRNDKIKSVIKHLYDLRKKMKKEDNPAQLVIKLLMNSLYGKTLLKPIYTDTVVKHEDKYEAYVSYNYNSIHSSVKV